MNAIRLVHLPLHIRDTSYNLHRTKTTKKEKMTRGNTEILIYNLIRYINSPQIF